MKFCFTFTLTSILLFLASTNFAQNNNCFLEDFYPKYTTAPPSENFEKPFDQATVLITINSADTIGKISNYIFGNAFPSWLGNVTNDQVLLKNLQLLAPSFIRYPGGSWSDIFFWDGKATDIPGTVWDGTQNKWITLTPQSGKNSWPTTLDNYYTMRDNVGCQGLITINYGYARYGTSANPVAKAAHLAADWVRYDDGRTMYWEIGNENGGPWEAGWKIDTTLNKDGQPEVITGELYGKHFKVFADSMRAAAAEIGGTIYIGGQIIQYNGENPPSWNIVDRTWNLGYFKEVGDAADFYVMHNYFGSSSTTLKGQVDNARTEIIKNINFIRQDITNKNAASKPVAITEWNCGGPDNAKTSIANGLQAVVLFSEMIKNNFGMSSRWPLANWDKDGMFYRGNDSSIPSWNPRPDFFYIYYLEQFTGDHSISTSIAGNSDILSYATIFTSGQRCVVVVNKGKNDQVVKLLPTGGVGVKYYVYSLIGGDTQDFSQSVTVNDESASGTEWGPIANLESIPARAYSIVDEINFVSPAQSVQYAMIEPGNNILSVNQEIGVIDKFVLNQNYPNPFNPKTIVTYSVPQATYIKLKVYDVLGNEITTLVNEVQPTGVYEVEFNPASENLDLSNGVYFYRLKADNFIQTKKMVLLK